MKRILLLTGIVSSLATTGCIVSDGERHEHPRYERPREVIVEPAVEVRPPEINVR